MMPTPSRTAVDDLSSVAGRGAGRSHFNGGMAPRFLTLLTAILSRWAKNYAHATDIKRSQSRDFLRVSYDNRIGHLMSRKDTENSLGIRGRGIVVSIRDRNQAARPPPSTRLAPILSMLGWCFCRNKLKLISRRRAIREIGAKGNMRCGTRGTFLTSRRRLRIALRKTSDWRRLFHDPDRQP